MSPIRDTSRRILTVLDILITNALIVDGTGRAAFHGEIGIENGKIVEVRNLPDRVGEGDPAPVQLESPRAKRVIDAAGKAVTPGFIDIHSHADRGVLTHPEAQSSLLMGVTTEITGNCGGSMAPLSDATAAQMKRWMKNIDFDWRSLDQFLSRLEEQGVGNNHGLFVGQGTIRGAVMGREKRFPTQAEVQRMLELTEESMEAGAFGISTGRAYVPGSFSSLKEVVALTEIVGQYRGIYTSHIADQWAHVHRATREVLEIGLRTGALAQVAHQKVVGKDNWGGAEEVLAILEEGQMMGVDIMADVYPYTFSQVFSLERLLPEALSGDTRHQTLDLLRQESAVDRLRKEFKENPTYISERLMLYGVVQCENTADLQWLDMGEVAASLSTDLAGALLHLLLENELRVKVAGIMSEEDLKAILAHPLVMVGSDSVLRSLDEDRETEKDWSSVHPREYGTFPRILGRYVRDEGLLSLEEAVRKMTGMPADRLELPYRGQIARGFWADLVIFDPGTISDGATIADPCSPPKGIDYVLVNGEIAVRDNEVQSVLAGQVLRDTQGRMLY